MARIDNATVMQCDRCGRNKWYKDTTDPDIKTWYNTIRLDADGKEPRLPVLHELLAGIRQPVEGHRQRLR